MAERTNDREPRTMREAIEMQGLLVAANPREIRITGIPIRCTCVVKGEHPGRVCPTGRQDPEQLLAYYRRSPLRNFLNRIMGIFKG